MLDPQIFNFGLPLIPWPEAFPIMERRCVSLSEVLNDAIWRIEQVAKTVSSHRGAYIEIAGGVAGLISAGGQMILELARGDAAMGLLMGLGLAGALVVTAHGIWRAAHPENLEGLLAQLRSLLGEISRVRSNIAGAMSWRAKGQLDNANILGDDAEKGLIELSPAVGALYGRLVGARLA